MSPQIITDKLTGTLRAAYHLTQKMYRRTVHRARYGTADMFNDIIIETSTRCNRRCAYCPNSRFERGLNDNEQRMPEELWRRIIDDLASIGFSGRISPHFYGEPLLDERLPHLLQYAHDHLPRASVKIYTNGDLLDIPMLESLARVGVRRYLVTLHGNTSEQTATMARVQTLHRYIAKERRNIRIDVLDIQRNTALSNRGGLVKVKNAGGSMYCMNPNNPVTIDHQGNVLLCCNDYLGQVVFGNVGMQPLLSIWHSAEYTRVRNELQKGVLTLDICKQCAA